MLLDALMLDHDHENNKEIDSMTTKWFEHVNSAQEEHGGSISNIRVQAEKCHVNFSLIIMWNCWINEISSSSTAIS